MSKGSTKKTTTKKKVQDLVIRDGEKVIGGATSTDRPTESLSLNFTKIEYKY